MRTRGRKQRNSNLDPGAVLTGIGGPGAVLSTPFTDGETEARGGGSLWRARVQLFPQLVFTERSCVPGPDSAGTQARDKDS